MQINSINNNQYSYYNRKNQNKSKEQQSVAFNGKLPSSMTDVYSGIANNSMFQKFIHFFSLSDKSFTHLLAIESGILSSFYMFCTLKNKEIEKEQKPQMIINDTLTLGFSTAGAYLTDGKVKKVYDGFVENHFKNNEDFYIDLGKKEQNKSNKKSPLDNLLEKIENKTTAEETSKKIGEDIKNIVGKGDKAFQIKKEELNAVQDKAKQIITSSNSAKEAQNSVKNLVEKYYNLSAARFGADNIKPAFSKLRGLVVFGFIYRFVSPVAFTPVANKLSSIFCPHNKKGNCSFVAPFTVNKKEQEYNIAA